MRLIDYLDKGAIARRRRAVPDDGTADLSYGEVQRSATASRAACSVGHRPGDKVAVLSSNDAQAFACVFGISRAAAVWCPVNPRNEAAENRFVLDAFDCAADLPQRYAPMVEQMRAGSAQGARVRLHRRELSFAPSLALARRRGDAPIERAPIDDLAMIAGTGGTTGRPKGVMLSGRNLETMTRADADGLSLRRPPDLPGAGPADACGRRAVPAGDGAGRARS